MKGYEVVVFPREGESTLVAMEPSRADAENTAWTADIHLSERARTSANERNATR